MPHHPLKRGLVLSHLYEDEFNLHVNEISFLTRELRMRNTSYRELWENVSLDRSIRCKLYANEVRTRLSIKLLSNLN